MSFMPRFTGRSPVDLETALRYVPSLGASEAHASRSDRYTYIPTVDILRGLDREGFKIFNATQSRTRDASRREFTKHMLRLRRVDAVAIGDSFPEIVLVNSHDGTSSYRMVGGIFRLVCSNGMIVSESEFGEVRVPHKGNIVDNVIEGAYRIVNQFDRIGGTVDEMRSITLNTREAEAMARAAIPLRFDVSEGEALPVTPSQALAPRRFADNGSDLWSTFNRLQENLVKGGIDVRRPDANGRIPRRGRASREVTGIDQNVKLNQALFALAEEMAAIKAAA